MKRALLTVVIALLPCALSGAQEQPQEKSKPPGDVAAKPAESGQTVNVKVDLTITEQAGSAATVTKVVSILAGDGQAGRIRSYSPGAPKTGELNVDVRPRLLERDLIQLGLVVEYRPGTTEGTASPTPGQSQSLTVFVQNGRPLLISQSADPNSDRTVKLEIRATVQR
jgi:hypothetical protein